VELEAEVAAAEEVDGQPPDVPAAEVVAAAELVVHGADEPVAAAVELEVHTEEDVAAAEEEVEALVGAADDALLVQVLLVAAAEELEL
jgi:hypothetical protein